MAALGERGGGSEHDVYVTGEEGHLVVIRSTIQDSYGFRGRSPAQYLKRLKDYNRVFPALQTRMIGVSQNARGNGVIWTAQPFIEGREFEDDRALQEEMERRGWERIDKDFDENILYRHAGSGVVIRDAHGGNVLVKGDELFPVDVIVDDVGDTASFSPGRRSGRGGVEEGQGGRQERNAF